MRYLIETATNSNKHHVSRRHECVETIIETIPMTSVQSERNFSTMNCFCTKTRLALSSKSVNALMFLKRYFQFQNI